MVRRVVKLFYREFRGLHQAAYVLALFAFASQILALIRDRALAHTFGAGIELDLYYAAFRIPDILFVIFASMLSVYVLIPFIAKLQNNKSDAAAARLLSQVFTFFLLAYSSIAALLFLFAPVLLPTLFPALNPPEHETLLTLFRILLLQPFFLGLSALFGVITQLRQRFIVYAVSPILYNIGILVGVMVFYPYVGLTGLVWGVVLGAVAHAAIQLPLILQSPLRFSISWPRWRELLKIFKVALPRAATLSLNQFVLLVLTILATGMTVGSVSVFQFAFNLQSVPLTIIGVSYSVAAFPVLAKLLASEEFEKFKTQVANAFRHIIFWSLPVIFLIIILRAHIVRVLLGSGSFDWDATRLTAAILAVFIVSLVAQAINLLSIRAFYAHSDTRTPLIIAFIGSAFTLTIAYISYAYLHALQPVQDTIVSLLRLEEVTGTEVVLLALSFAVGVSVQASLMAWRLHRTFPGICSGIADTFKHSFTAALAGGIVTYGTLQFVVDGIRQDTFIGIFLQGAVAGVLGILTIYVVYRWMNGREFQEIHTAVTRRFDMRNYFGLKR